MTDKAKILFHASAKDFEKIPGSPVAYWLSRQSFSNFCSLEQLKKYALPRIGLITGDNNRFLRYWHEVSFRKIGFNINNIEDSINSKCKWFPYQKGGEYRQWQGNTEYIVDWENNGYLMRNDNFDGNRVKSHNYNDEYSFVEGITWTSVSTESFACRYSPKGFLFDAAGPICYIKNNNMLFNILAFLSSKTAKYYLSVLNPTINFHPGYIEVLPWKDTNENATVINQLAKANIKISKSDWDSFETSWDFQRHPLAFVKKEYGVTSELFYDGKLESSKQVPLLESHFNHWRQECEQRFNQLKTNEEELNRIFIEIYGLQDELTPEVEDKDVTVSKADLGRDIRSFISYAVGCMFGRYSLDKPGLILANQGETLAAYLKQIPTPSFTPDEDGVIPILDEDWFDDDIVTRFNEFLKVTFGGNQPVLGLDIQPARDTLATSFFHENMSFIEEALGKDLRSYFTKDFYKEHLQRYHNRPIYWLFSSPKGAFSALVYMHRYRPETAGIVLTYLRSHITKVTERIHNLDVTIDSADSTAGMKSKAIRERSKLQKNLQEMEDYERDVLYPLSTEKIAIDLDDGVKVNYQKFGKALRKVTGLDAKEE